MDDLLYSLSLRWERCVFEVTGLSCSLLLLFTPLITPAVYYRNICLTISIKHWHTGPSALDDGHWIISEVQRERWSHRQRIDDLLFVQNHWPAVALLVFQESLTMKLWNTDQIIWWDSTLCSLRCYFWLMFCRWNSFIYFLVFFHLASSPGCIDQHQSCHSSVMVQVFIRCVWEQLHVFEIIIWSPERLLFEVRGGQAHILIIRVIKQRRWGEHH